MNFVEERLRIYRDLNKINNQNELEKFSISLEDRFGSMPKEAKELVESMKIKWLGTELGLGKIILKSGKMILHFNEDEGNEPAENIITAFLKKIQENPSRYRMKQTSRLSIIIESVYSVIEAFITLQEIKNHK